VPAFPIPEGLPHHPQISRGQTHAWSAIPDCPGGSTGTSRPFASLRAKGAPLRGGSLLWTTWAIRSADAKNGHLTTLQQIAADLERHRHDPAGAARDLEQPRLSGFPVQPAVRRTAGALPELWDAMEPVTLVIPTFNEAETIGAAIREIPAAYRLNIIVADGGSTDGTRRIARIAGARVVNAGRGYGRACALAAEKAHPASTVIAFMDGDE
jgi:Glycosyl transferase family 2